MLYIYRYTIDGEPKYLVDAQELIRPERNTLSVSFEDVEKYNQQLATTILEEYYRYYWPKQNHTIFTVIFPLVKAGIK